MFFRYKLLVVMLLANTLPSPFFVSASTNTPETSLRLSPENAEQIRVDFLLDVAEAYAREENFTAAIGAYERILQVAPQNEEARFQLSHIYIVIKKYGKAEELILQLIKEYPDNSTLYNNLAWVYATAEDPSVRDGKKAVHYAQEAMLLAPNDYHIWSTLSEAHYTAGDYEKALQAIEHMSRLIYRYSQNVSEESVEGYKQQVLKCQRALEAAEVMNGSK